MCLAIYKPAGQTVPQQFLQNGYYMNPHGAGFAYALNGELKMEKGFFSFAEFWEAYSAVPTEANAIIHFRAATTGDINAYNCHPWQINEDYVLIHNGVFSGFGNNTISDTGDFTRSIIRPLFDSLKPGTDINSVWFRYFMRATIGNWNKVVALGKDGSFGIYNEFNGHRLDDNGQQVMGEDRENHVWYSNNYFLFVDAEAEAEEALEKKGGKGKRKKKVTRAVVEIPRLTAV